VTTYFFKAVASDGKIRTGTFPAENDKAVAKELRRQGLTPVYVGLEQKKQFELKLPTLGAAKRKDVLFFTQELATLLNAGVPLDRALTITTELTERPVFRGVLLDVLRVVKGGKTLADSLGTHPEYFGDLFVNMVRAGEASGSLAIVFEQLSEFEKTRDELRSYIISSMIYPALLTLVGFSSIFLLMNFVVPRFASVFEQSRMQIPAPTRMMLETSKFIQSYAWIAGLAVVLLVITHQTYTRTVEGRLWWDTFRLRLPLIGEAMRKAETARFARAMATLVANSVPLVQSIGIAGAILNNRKIAGALEAVSQGVKRGEGLSGPLRKTGQFPALAGHLLSVGEETGRLDKMFARMAEIYEEETRSSIKRFTALFEPVVILVMGVLIGALILSLMMAITSINEVVV